MSAEVPQKRLTPTASPRNAFHNRQNRRLRNAFRRLRQPSVPAGQAAGYIKEVLTIDLSVFFPIWAKLTLAQQAELTAAATEVSLQKGAMRQGGSGDCTGLLLVACGRLRAYILSEEGREITLYRLFDRDICLFSASCIMHSIQFALTIEAEKDTQLQVIPAEVYRRIMEESAPLSNYTNEIMASRFSEVMWLMEQVLWKRFDRRLAGFLLEESALEETPSLRITHEAIANHLGTAREVVTRMLRYFQTEGMVRLARGVVELTDREKLRTLQNA